MWCFACSARASRVESKERYGFRHLHDESSAFTREAIFVIGKLYPQGWCVRDRAFSKVCTSMLDHDSLSIFASDG